MLGKLDFFRLVVASLATYRLAILISKDDGPFDIIKIPRRYISKRAGHYQAIYRSLEGSPDDSARVKLNKAFWFVWNSIAKLLECPYCIGVWIAILCFWMIISPSILGDTLLAVFAIAGLQTLFQTIGDSW